MNGLTGQWAHLNTTFLPVRWTGFSPAAPCVDPTNNWNYIDPADSTRRINVQTTTIPDGIWKLRLELTKLSFSGPTRVEWTLAFPDGFPRWPNNYTLGDRFTLGWAFGGGATQALYIPYYSQIAPNSCVLP